MVGNVTLTESETRDGATHETLFTIPIGEDGVQYRSFVTEADVENRTQQEGATDEEGETSRPDIGSLPWGPVALSVGPGPTFFIADAANNRILHCDTNGARIATLQLTEQEIVRVGDVEATPQALWVLDDELDAPAVLRFPAMDESNAEEASPPSHESVTGQGPFYAREAERIALRPRASESNDEAPLAESAPVEEPQPDIATGIKVDSEGVLIEYGYGAHYYNPAQTTEDAAEMEAPPNPAPVAGLTVNGQVYQLLRAGFASDSDSVAYLMVGDNRIPIEGVTNLDGLRLLGVNPMDGSVYIVVEQVALMETLQVDQTVRRYAADGMLLGKARIPLWDSVVYVPNGLAVGPDGEAYALVARRDGLDVQRLHFVPELASLFSDAPAAEESDEAAWSAESTSLAPRTRDQIIAEAWRYRNNLRGYSNQNLYGNCPGRRKPHYFDTMSPWGKDEQNRPIYPSVAYKWGGDDSVDKYNQRLDNDVPAGDIPVDRNDNVLACATGVDCSGFVSRCWGISYHITSMLPRSNVSRRIERDQLMPGDILNKAADHVRLFHHIDEQGVWAFESTVTSDVDRVIYRPRQWAEYLGFVPLRRRNVTPDP